MIDFKDQQQLQTLISDEFSDWSNRLLITQRMIDDFAAISGDHLWIHTDPQRCVTDSPFKTTIAHGFLILSVLSQLHAGADISKQIGGYKQIMNYGSDKLRFMSPVPVDSEIHARSRVAAINVQEHKTTATLEWQVAVVGQENLSLVYHMTLVFM
ncbi:MAG: MaoC family dehydratase [Gammaproteobacteria bacterium]|nr:MaoC family dehydratase [Gammaproteobacteria bacterium]